MLQNFEVTSDISCVQIPYRGSQFLPQEKENVVVVVVVIVVVVVVEVVLTLISDIFTVPCKREL
jgi:hypothetical protein